MALDSVLFFWGALLWSYIYLIGPGGEWMGWMDG